MKKLIILALVAIVTLTGCRSGRKASKTVTPAEIEVVSGKTPLQDDKQQIQTGKDETVDLAQSATGIDALTSKMSVVLGGGGKSVKCGGTYRLKRNDVIQLNLTYTMFLTINVGVLEMTRDSILVVDKLHNQYCRAAYSDVPALQKAGIDFNLLQKVFWGEATDLNNNSFKVTYKDWTTLGTGKFPQEIDFKLASGKKSYFANFTLDKLKANEDWNTRTKVSGKYTPVSIETVMKKIMSVAK